MLRQTELAHVFDVHQHVVARGALDNMWVKTNPQPLRELAELTRLLEAAW